MEYPSYPSAPGPRLRWASILAGSAVTLATLAGLNLFGVGLGYLPAAASTISSIANVARPGGFSGAWWTLASGIAAYYLGGWIASRLSDSGHRSDAVIFGIVSWAAASLAAIYVPAAALGGALTIAASGTFVFLSMLLQAASAAAGGLAGGRFYLPVPATEYRKSHREAVGTR